MTCSYASAPGDDSAVCGISSLREVPLPDWRGGNSMDINQGAAVLLLILLLSLLLWTRRV